MSFKYETQHNSPNYTEGSRAQATWGRPYTVTAIAIHWWGDPNRNPSYEGVINTLVSPSSGVSSHFVATGTGRRVAQLVDLQNASWATNSANPWTVSIECDPRCREEDYDVVAELIANIRSVYGNIPLVPHRQFVATACPGNYNLAELDRRANLKDGSGDWGVVSNKVIAQPVPTAPAVSEVSREVFAPLKNFKFNKDSRMYDVITGAVSGDKVYALGTEISMKQLLTLSNGNKWYRTAYSSDRELATGFRAEDIIAVEPVVVPAPEPVITPKPTEEPSKPPVDEKPTTTPVETTTLLEDVTRWFKAILDYLSKFTRSK